MISSASEAIREVEVMGVYIFLFQSFNQPTICRERYTERSEHCHGALGDLGGTFCWKFCGGPSHFYFLVVN